MAEPKTERLTDVESKIRSGLRVHARAEQRVRSVQLADKLSEIHTQIGEIQPPTAEDAPEVKSFFSNVDRNLQRTRKVAEVVEDSLQVGLGHSKLARIAMTGAQLNSGVALVTASHNLLISANELTRANASVNSIQDIAADRFHEFYRAIGLFTVEAVLFTTPINYRIAWKGTRFLNNRFLYALRHSGFSGPVDGLLKGLHRLLLSEIHYVIRGIVPAALRTPAELATYLASMATQTLELLMEFSEIEFTELPAKAREVIEEYWTFVEGAYEVTVSNVDVDIEQIVSTVVSQVTGDVDIFSIPEPNYNVGL